MIVSLTVFKIALDIVSPAKSCLKLCAIRLAPNNPAISWVFCPIINSELVEIILIRPDRRLNFTDSDKINDPETG